MKRLSSRSTYFYKRLFPAFWFGILVWMMSSVLLAPCKQQSDVWGFFFFCAFVAAVGYFLMKYLVFDLFDEVYDEGASLLFKNKGRTLRVNLSDIKNVSYSVLINPPRVTLSLRHRTEFGDELSFSPRGGLIPFQKNQDILDLIDRIDRTRS
ncbi:MAG TPA: hypothetical protein PLT45_01965 [Smithella sp.]|nr:hypothetical protein [Smithella sp.]